MTVHISIHIDGPTTQDVERDLARLGTHLNALNAHLSALNTPAPAPAESAPAEPEKADKTKPAYLWSDEHQFGLKVTSAENQEKLRGEGYRDVSASELKRLQKQADKAKAETETEDKAADKAEDTDGGEPEEKLTLDDVKRAAREFIARHADNTTGQKAAKALLKERFDSAKVSALEEDQFADAIAMFQNADVDSDDDLED